MSSSPDRENQSNSLQKKENSISSSQNSEEKSEKPSIVTEVENASDEVKHIKNLSCSSPSFDPIQDTPKHCNKTSGTKINRTEANKRKKSGLSSFSPRRTMGSGNIEGPNNSLNHPGYPAMNAPSTRYAPHGYNVGGPSNSYTQRGGGYYQGQESSSSMPLPPHDNSNGPGSYPNHRPHGANTGNNAPGGAYSYGNGRGYYPPGQPRMNQNGPPKPHPSTISPGNSQYGTNNHNHLGHNVHNGHHNMPHRGPANQQRPPPFPPTHSNRSHYHNDPRSNSRGDTVMNNGGPPLPSSYYNNNGHSNVGDYSTHGNNSNNNHYSSNHPPHPPHHPPHHPPLRTTGSRDPHPPPYGAPDNSYGNRNRYQDHRVQTHPHSSHAGGNNGYMYNLDENPSYGSHNDPPQSSLSYRDQQQPHSHSRNSDSQPQHPYNNGNNQSYSSQPFNRGGGRYPPHDNSSMNRSRRDEEPLSYNSKYNDSNRNNNIPSPPSPPSHDYSPDQDLSYRNMNGNVISTSLSSSMDKTTKSPHHHRHNHNHRSNSTNLTRTVSSSFEGGASGSGGYGNHLHPSNNIRNKSNMPSNSSIPYYPPKEDSYRHDRRSTNARDVPSNHNKDHLPPTSNIAFEQDVAAHHGHYNNYDEEQRKGNHYKNPKKIGEYHPSDQGSDSSWHQLNKVASVDRNEFERRSVCDNVTGEIELPLMSLQANPSNLESLASLSSVASIQEQLPLDPVDSKDEEMVVSPTRLPGENVRRNSHPLSYDVDDSSLFKHDDKGQNEKCPKSTETKDPIVGKKRSREKEMESRDSSKINIDEDQGAPKNKKKQTKSSSGTENDKDESSPSRKKMTLRSSHQTDEPPTPKLRDEPIKFSDSPNLLQMPSGSKLEVPNFTNKKAMHNSNGGDAHGSTGPQMKQPKPKYPQPHPDNPNGPQQIHQAPKSKDGKCKNVQSSNSSFTSTIAQADGGRQGHRGVSPKQNCSYDSRGGSSNSRFTPLLNPRRGSCSSGSITVMGPLGNDQHESSSNVGLGLGHIMTMPSMASWEIQNQDSFNSGMHTEGGSVASAGERPGIMATGSLSNKSTGSGSGFPLLSSFSFTNDYNMVSGGSSYTRPRSSPTNNYSEERSIGNNATIEPKPQRPPPVPPHNQGHRSQPTKFHGGSLPETRNQSFDSYGRNHGGNQQHSNYHDYGTRGRNDRSEDDLMSSNNSSNRPPYGAPPGRDHHHYPHPPSRQRGGGGHEERTGVGGSFGGPGPAPPPPPPHPHANNTPHSSHHGRPPHHYPSLQNTKSNSWGGHPPPHQYPSNVPHIPHGPVHSQSFGSTSSTQQHHYRHHSYNQRPGSPPRYPQQRIHHAPDEFQPPPREFIHNNKPPPTVFIVSNPNHNRSNDSNMNVSSAMKGVYSWNKDDDARLTDVMKKFRNPKSWEPIAKEHGRGKSAKECHERWIRYLKPGVRKGQWQDHEDAIVVEAVTTSSEQPFTRWSDLATRLPGRVGKQIRDRWVNHLNPAINHMPFTREDDLLLFKGHEDLGKRWVEISTKFFNSTRSENHIKNRWYSASFKKFIANEYGPDAYSGGKSAANKNKSKAEEATVSKEEAKKVVGLGANDKSNVTVEKVKVPAAKEE